MKQINPKKRLIPVFTLYFMLLSCNQKDEVGRELFTSLPSDSTNVDFINQLTETEQFNMIQYLYFNNGAGVAAGDINNDGLVDLYFTSNQNPNKLYLNKGNLIFEDITESAGVSGTGDWKTGVTMADINGDGFLDIYVCEVGNYKTVHGRNQLFINQGDLTFREEAQEYGLDFQGFSTQAAFFDYDLDGDLDMYLLNHSVHTSRSYGDVNLRFDHDSLAGDRLYRNDEVNGRMFFHDVAPQSGIYNSQIGYGLAVNISDINNDGYPDIFIDNDFHENDYLYINNGDGTFTNRMTDYIEHTSRSSMGNDIADFNNDGLLDLIVLDMLPEEENIRKQSGGEDDYELVTLKLMHGYGHQFVRNTLQLNLGEGTFAEIGRLAGVYSTDWSWSPLFCDVDNDGLKDLFISNGIFRRANDLDYVKFLVNNDFFSTEENKDTPDSVLYDKMPLDPCFNYMYRNNGDLTFTNMAHSWGFGVKSYSNGATYADLDNDGDLDIVCNNINDKAFIYRNNATDILSNHYLFFSFRGTGYNKRGIGARVTVYCNNQIQVVEQNPVRGFESATSDVLHLGLGECGLVDSLVVRWPDRSEQVLKNLKADTLITFDISEAKQSFSTKTAVENKSRLFSSSNISGLVFRHQEDKVEDFSREKLIPHSLFNEGPALVAGDLNGDNREDLFVGGAKGQAARLFFQQGDGSFSPGDPAAFTRDLYCEDIDAAIFDADGNNYPDLYIVHGGNEVSAGSQILADRLLINDGKGGFMESLNGALPFEGNNGSCVRPCDFDNDGDIDLFVGSRSVPGAYGLSPKQVLLENDGKGHFIDVTAFRSKDLEKAGMVTDACWVDYDGDGDKDLIIAGEWMKVSVFSNDNGTFSDVTKRSGLEETSGFWNCISAADIDGDGDVDLIAGNLGRNSILKASVREPVTMYINDFDKNLILDQIICSYQDGISYPVASLDELISQIPSLEKKFPSYADFGGKTARQIFGRSLNSSIVKTAVLLESCMFLNNGDGTFNTVKLPVTAQFSPVRDILPGDFDRDGTTDLILAGNDYSVRPSMGRYDASFGWFLSGNGGSVFKTFFPGESGLKIKGDARKIVTLRIGGKPYIVAAVNDGDIQIFQLSE